MNHLKTRIGLVLAATYLAIVLLALISSFSSDVDLAGLVPMALTLPWSFWLLVNLPDNLGVGQWTGFTLIMLCALINALIIYTFTLLITILWSKVTSKEKLPDNSENM